MTVQEFAQKAAERFCWRCMMEHHVFPPDHLYTEWTHGTDQLVSGVTVGPEPCDAHIIHHLLAEVQRKEECR